MKRESVGLAQSVKARLLDGGIMIRMDFEQIARR